MQMATPTGQSLGATRWIQIECAYRRSTSYQGVSPSNPYHRRGPTRRDAYEEEGGILQVGIKAALNNDESRSVGGNVTESDEVGLAIGNAQHNKSSDEGVRSQSDTMLAIDLHGLIFGGYEVGLTTTPSRLLILRLRNPSHRSLKPQDPTSCPA